MYLFHKDFHVKSYEKHMIEANRKYWAESPSIDHGEEWIYVYHQWPGDIAGIAYEDIVAKGLQEKEKKPIAAVTYNADQTRIDELDDSFRIEHKYHLNPYEQKGWLSNIRTFIVAQYLAFTTYGKKKKLFQMKYRGISCGDEIHDSIVHENALYYNAKGTHGEQYDCFDIDRTTYFQYIRNALTVIDQAYMLFKEKKPAYIVATAWIEISGLFEDVARKMGARILVCEPGGWKNIVQIAQGEKVWIGDMLRRQIEVSLERHPLKESIDENFFVYKTTNNSSQDLIKDLGLDPKKKNIFIMSHILIDAPRRAYRHDVYNEYHEWLLDTFKIIREIPDVNWIIKDHPVSAKYMQDSYIKSIFEKNRTSNIYWCDKATSAMQIKEIADCIVTCAGEAGLEYWAYGIPTITTSFSYFCKWNISYHMKTREEYENALKHIENLKAPTPESVEQARRYLTAYKHMNDTTDALSLLYFNKEKKKFEADKEGGIGMEMIHFSFCKQYIELLKEKQIEVSTIYRLEDMCDMV